MGALKNTPTDDALKERMYKMCTDTILKIEKYAEEKIKERMEKEQRVNKTPKS